MSGAGLGYSIVDARSTFTGYLGAGKILAPKSDDVAGKTEADAATDVISLWFDQVDDFLDEINEVFTNDKAILTLTIGDGTGATSPRVVHSSSTSGTLTFSTGTSDGNNDKKIEHLSSGVLRISHHNGTSWSRIIDMSSESFTFGSGSGAPIWYANKAAASSFQLRISDNGTRRWVHSVTTDYNLNRYDNTGTFQDTPLKIIQSSGNVQVNSVLEIMNANAKLDMGDYSGTPEIRLGKGASSSAVIYFEQAATTTMNDKQINLNSSEELTFRHYNGTSWSTAFKISNSGYLQLRSSGAQLLSGTGAPGSSTGNDGDFYFRTDGGASTNLYVKSGGTWSAKA